MIRKLFLVILVICGALIAELACFALVNFGPLLINDLLLAK